MKVKRRKYSLRNCGPVKKKKRKEVNDLDFKKVFPFYNFDQNKIDLDLVRRFLFQNKIPYYYLYHEEMVRQQRKEREKLSEEEQMSLLEDDDLIEDRFEILDI